MIENIETIDLLFYFVDDFKRINIALFKLVYFNKINKL